MAAKKNSEMNVNYKKLMIVSDARLDGIEVFNHQQRGVKSHDIAESKKEKDQIPYNIYEGERCRIVGIGKDKDTYECAFSVRFESVVGIEPVSVQNMIADQYTDLKEFTKTDVVKNAVSHIAKYIGYNIMSGSWLWRNRLEATDITIEVSLDDNVIATSKALDYSLRCVKLNGDNPSESDEFKTEAKDLIEEIQNALLGNSGFGTTFKVKAIVKGSYGQDVWPSQKFVQKGPKEFYSFDKGVYAISSDKVSNALRTFDIFHNDPKFPDIVNPIEPNGGNLRLGVFLRNNKNNFLTLLWKSVKAVKEGQPVSPEDAIFIVGNLIRGGVFTHTNKD